MATAELFDAGTDEAPASASSPTPTVSPPLPAASPLWAELPLSELEPSV